MDRNLGREPGPPLGVLTVSVGRPQRVAVGERTVLTSIFKSPVAGPVRVRGTNLEGDEQSDLTVHGGYHKAIYAYPSEHYAYWREQLPDAALDHGAFGENLTTTGLTEDSLHVGDRLRVGSTVLMVTQPRMPCFKLGIRFDRPDMVKRFLASRRSGIYFAVESDGHIAAGDPIAILSRHPLALSIREVLGMYIGDPAPVERLRAAADHDGLPESWRDAIRERLAAES